MIDIVFNAIDKFYKKNDYSAFKICCSKQIQLFDKIREYIDKQEFKLEEIQDYPDNPSKIWYIHFDDYKKGEFEISYETKLHISKVASLFYIQHEYSVKNMDEDRMSPVLRDADNQAYTKKQFALHEKISSVLIKNGYYEIGYADMHETVEGFKMPGGVTIFGPNVTVEHLLFMDLFNICDK
ncbi:MAG: hypothetical protein WCS92_01295 [Candidatus Babeliales bacterium]|jgi:hypothetical protein